MNRGLLAAVGVLIVFTSSSLAQTPVPQGKKTISSPGADKVKTKQRPESRMDRIWVAAMDRINYQNDLWFNNGDFLRSINSLRFVNDVYPADWEIATNLGWLLESTENNTEAIAVYTRYKNFNLKTDPDAPWPLANFYFKKKQYDKVPPLLEPSMKATPHPNSYRVLAHSLERLKKYKESLQIWNDLIARFPDDGAAKVNRDRVKKKLAAG